MPGKQPRRTSTIHAWDEFWSVTRVFHLHALGEPEEQTPEQDLWVEAVTELQESGKLTAKQVLALTRVIELTARKE